jgi:hypothetical protein
VISRSPEERRRLRFMRTRKGPAPCGTCVTPRPAFLNGVPAHQLAVQHCVEAFAAFRALDMATRGFARAAKPAAKAAISGRPSTYSGA